MNRRQFYDHIADVVSMNNIKNKNNKESGDNNKDNNNKKTIEPPPESCITKTFRVMCTSSPPPYYTEYRTKDVDGVQVTADFIHATRARYGYSKRPNTNLRASNISGTSEYSETNNDDEEKLSRMLRESGSRASIAKSPVLRSLRYRASSVSTTKVKNKKGGTSSLKMITNDPTHSVLEDIGKTDA